MAIIKYKEPLYAHIDINYSESGSATMPTYVLDFPERGGVALKKTGEKPIYEMIQANLVNCDLQNVIESCVHTNQYAVCSQDNLNTLIADFTGLTNIGDIYAGAKRMENTWKDLPLEVREEFGSDIKKFIRGIGTEEFNNKVSNGFNKFNDVINKSLSTNVTPGISPLPSVITPELNIDKEVSNES